MNATALKNTLMRHTTTRGMRGMRGAILAPHFLSAHSPVYVQTEPPSP